MTVETGRGWTMCLGDCLEVMPTLGQVDHVITDPPYSEHVHAKLGAEGRGDGFAPRASLSFEHLTASGAQALAVEFARLAKRWILAFGDERCQGYWLASGLPWVRGGIWLKTDPMPQMSGDRPGSGVDYISIMHAVRARGSGRMRWNGGGRAAVWTHGIERRNRWHATPKPEGLMLDLVDDFTDAGETVLDAFAGSGTTGVACLRRGRAFVGIERDPATFALAVERLRTEESGSTLQAARAGQLPLLGGSR